ADRAPLAAVEFSGAQPGKDSSQGSAIKTPVPRRKVLREMEPEKVCLARRMMKAPFVTRRSLISELWTCDNALDKRAETVIAGGEFCAHPFEQWIVTRKKGPPQAIRAKLEAQI